MKLSLEGVVISQELEGKVKKMAVSKESYIKKNNDDKMPSKGGNGRDEQQLGQQADAKNQLVEGKDNQNEESQENEMAVMINIKKEDLDPRILDSAERLGISENALIVLIRRYLRKDETGKTIETPEEMFRRVANNIAEADKVYDPKADINKTAQKFYDLMTNRYFMPNSPTLMNAGSNLQQLSACFVLPVEDSMESIFEAIKNTALIHKSGGGTGFSFSRIRPKNEVVQSTKGIASGPISFMTVFDAATETIKQGGTRRGANMAILRVDHPDILEFIRAKQENDRLNNFNISVAITEKFMEAYKEEQNFDLINPLTGEVTESIPAKKIFDEIVDRAWSNGEPGIVFIDQINKSNPLIKLGAIESTNPCGEQPLMPYESCNLGSINLAAMARKKDQGYDIDYDLLRETVHDAVHFLDNVIDMNNYPLPQIEELTKQNRKIGLGVMGFADLLLKLRVPYNSEEAVKIGGCLMAYIQKTSREASKELAKKRGAFPNFNKSEYHKKGQAKLRNATTTTIAPTGTISIIAGCSSGIEPLFGLAFIRKVLDGDELLDVNSAFKEIAKQEGFYNHKMFEELGEGKQISEFAEVPDQIKKICVLSHDITPEWHVKMQAAFQKYTDNAVSKTINFPHDTAKEDIKKAFLMAYELKCKGLTVYRDGSREVQVLNRAQKKKADKPDVTEILGNGIEPLPRPEALHGITERVKTGCGNLYITINLIKDKPFEVFISMGKSGGCATSQNEAIARLTSLALRSGIKLSSIVKQLQGIRCPEQVFIQGRKVNSCADAIGYILSKYLPADDVMPQIKLGLNPQCPLCGGKLSHIETCVVCEQCGWDKCG